MSAAEENRARKLALAQQDDKQTVEIVQKKLMGTRQELEDLKKQFQSMKRNHDTLAENAKQDGPTRAKMQKKLDEYERELAMLKG